MKNKSMLSLYIAELIGTFFMVFLGCGAIISAEINPESLESFAIPLIFGGAVSIMIYSVGHISGAHFNPAVTIAFWATRKFPLKKVPGYLIAQIAGAKLAAITHFFIWGNQHSYGMTFLNSTIGVGILVEFILSFALMFVIMSVATDTRAVGELAGIAIGTTVALCAFVGGPITGASMNPARSLGPALVGGELHDIWIYILIPILGAISGAFVYQKIRCESDKNSEHGCC